MERVKNGDEVKITKLGTNHLEKAVVTDPNWSGRIKVEFNGNILSYQHHELQKIDHNGMHQSPKNRQGAKEGCIYFVFMLFYVPLTLRGLTNSDFYTFKSNFQGQIEGVEMLQEHSPTFAKVFQDISTVEEFYHWLQAGFLHTVFTPNTFDADASWAFDGGAHRATTMGYGKILGAVRIGQLRGVKRDCTASMPPEVRAVGHEYYCYGGWKNGYSFGDNTFAAGAEDKSDFGNLTYFDHSLQPPIPMTDPPFEAEAFVFDGKRAVDRKKMPAGSVMTERTKYMSSFTSTTWNTYPAPAYQVTMDPLMGADAARQFVKDLMWSRYIDLQTKVVFVDVNVFNAQLRKLCWVRLVAEMTDAGGVVPSSKYETFTPYEQYTPADYFYDGLWAIVLLFYLHYTREEYNNYRAYMKGITSRPGRMYARRRFVLQNSLQLMNITFFFFGSVCKIASYSLLPPDVHVTGSTYNDFKPAATFRNYQICIQATNAFLNWFKLVAILNFSPSFGIMTSTLVKAAHGVSGFLIVFIIVLFGFAQAHAMVYHARLSDFRTVGTTMFTLIRSLLGDFDFRSLQEAHGLMGPFLFLLFVGLAVFVVLNMLIAIISDAYVEARNEMSELPPVSISKEMHLYLSDLFNCKKEVNAKVHEGVQDPNQVDLGAADNTDVGGTENCHGHEYLGSDFLIQEQSRLIQELNSKVGRLESINVGGEGGEIINGLYKIKGKPGGGESDGKGMFGALLAHSQAEMQGLDVIMRHTTAVKDGNALFLGAVQKEIMEIRERQEEDNKRVQHELASLMNVLLANVSATQKLAATQSQLLQQIHSPSKNNRPAFTGPAAAGLATRSPATGSAWEPPRSPATGSAWEPPEMMAPPL
jgi:hypothetical protein